MKRNIITGIACAALLLPLATGCSEESPAGSGTKGRISPEVDLQAAPLTGKQTDSRAAADDPVSLSDLSLRVTSLDGDYTNTWTSVADFDPSTEFPVGRYSVEAFYGEETAEGYGQPYYYGAGEVKVTTDRTTPVAVNATLANSIVRIVYTDAFREYMTQYSARVHSEGGAYHEYDEASPEELYVRPGYTTIDLTVTKPNGKSGTLEVAAFTAKPRYRHTVTIDVNGGETGKAESLEVTFDDTLDSQEFEIDLSDDILSASGPVVTPVGFTPGEEIALVETAAASGDVKMNITARGKIETVTLTTRSAALLAAGWPAEVNLAAPEADVKARMQALGFNTLGIWNNPDEMGVLDFTKVLSKIPYVDGADNTSVFTVVVKDRQGKVSDPVEFSVTVSQLRLAITEGAIIADGEAMVMVDYNGASVADITFRAKNTRGTTSPVTVKSSAKDAATGLYTIYLTNSASDPVIKVVNNLDLIATVGGVTATATIKAPVLVIDTQSINSFARHTTVSVKFTDSSAAARSGEVKFYLSTDGGNTFTPAGSTPLASPSRAVVKTVTYDITGLKEKTDYTFYAILDDNKSLPAKFTTEEVIQLENAGMDDWDNDQMGDYQTLWYPSATKGTGYWATRNALTTSTHGKGSSIFSYGGTAYRATSGTMPANGNVAKSPSATANSGNQYEGSNAALVRTVGWGSGNTSFGYSGKCENITPGELFLGSTDASYNAVRGIKFGSRPSALQFMGRYIPFKEGNGDFGKAEIKVYAATGSQPIAEYSLEIGSTPEWTQFTLPLSYSTATRAARLEVNFYSSANPACLVYNSNYISDAGSANYTSKEYVGAKLYIDKIELIY